MGRCVSTRPSLATQRTFLGLLGRGGLMHVSSRDGSCSGSGTEIIFCFPTKRCILRGRRSGALARNIRGPTCSKGKGGADSSVVVCNKGFMVGKSKPSGAFVGVSAPGLPASARIVCSSPIVVGVGRGT